MYSFFMNFFLLIDTHPREVFRWYVELHTVLLTWYEKQSDIVKMYHCHFILLLVPEQRAATDTKFCS
jgi:hypothetical protein